MDNANWTFHLSMDSQFHYPCAIRWICLIDLIQQDPKSKWEKHEYFCFSVETIWNLIYFYDLWNYLIEYSSHFVMALLICPVILPIWKHKVTNIHDNIANDENFQLTERKTITTGLSCFHHKDSITPTAITIGISITNTERPGSRATDNLQKIKSVLDVGVTILTGVWRLRKCLFRRTWFNPVTVD